MKGVLVGILALVLIIGIFGSTGLMFLRAGRKNLNKMPSNRGGKIPSFFDGFIKTSIGYYLIIFVIFGSFLIICGVLKSLSN
jgi:hypothetical protein